MLHAGKGSVWFFLAGGRNLGNSSDRAWPFLLSLRERCVLPEIMDQPDLDTQEHGRALAGLARINAWSGSAQILWPALRDLARGKGNEGLRVLDVASGAGDVPIRLWKRTRRKGLAIQIDGCDRSPFAVAEANRRAAVAGASVRFFAIDALAQPLPDHYDVITCSLFLHHLPGDQAISFLQNAAASAGRLVLVNDLARSHLGYALAWCGTRLLTRSRVVHVDGPLSVRAAFTLAEARSLAVQAGLHGAQVSWRWPFRFLLKWEKK